MLFLPIIASGCVTMQDPETSQELRADEIARINPENRFTQTFVSRRANLNQLELWLRTETSETPGKVMITFRLFKDKACEIEMVKRDYALEPSKSAQSHQIKFPPIHSLGNQVYCFELSTHSGDLIIYGRNEDNYPLGEASIDNHPMPADASFRSGYDFDVHALFYDLINIGKNLFVLIPLALTFWLPGRFLLFITRLEKKFDWGARTALSMAFSLGLYPVLLVWTSAAGIVLSSKIVWTFMAVTIVAYAGLVVYQRKIRKKNRIKICWQVIARNLPLLGIFILTLGARLVMVRDLAAPAWVNSIHHALISRVIIDSGKLPSGYAPFFEINTASYHPGFHSSFSVFEWLSGMQLEEGMLLFGQVLNAAVIFGVYAMAHILTRNRYAGLIAALVSGVFSPMPAYYTSWGRYTQLAGLMILPAGFVFLYHLLENSSFWDTNHKRESQIAWLFSSGLLWAGLFLTHYRVSVFLFLLVFSYLVVKTIQRWRHREMGKKISASFFLMAFSIIIGIILSLPWWPAAFSTLFIPSLAWTGASDPTPFSGFSWSFLTAANGTYTLILAGLGFAWALIRRRSFEIVLFFWTALMFLFANLKTWRLPGATFINNTSVAITLFIPIAILCGYVVGWAIRGWMNLVPEKWKSVSNITVVLILGLVGLWGARSTIGIINPTTILFRSADKAGINWVEENLPREKSLLVNPFSWGYGVYAGADGGYWLSPLAGNPTRPPAVLYGLDNDNRRKYSQLSQQVIQNSSNAGELAEIMKDNDIEFVFLGAKGGAISAAALADSEEFRELFNQLGVHVFAITRP